MAMERVAGYCPMGCGKTLFAAEGGYITCSYVHCPNPTAVADILEDQETEHTVDLGETTFTVRHPLRERVADQILDCDLHNWIASRTGPPARVGRYRVTAHGSDDWFFVPLADAFSHPPTEGTQ